ncbi:MAG: TPD domain-containing protein [Euryarchaeota archaeon]|nr:TPD domain-containing protein [Euryarchaeota archaeon]
MRSPDKKLSERDAKEFHEAESKDRVTNVDQGETAIKADLFEVVVEKFLNEKGIKFRRQEDLLAEQQKEHGRPLNTPDFLIMDELRINGKDVAWIDAKNFYGADVSFAKKKTKKQMNRYIDE